MNLIKYFNTVIILFFFNSLFSQYDCWLTNVSDSSCKVFFNSFEESICEVLMASWEGNCSNGIGNGYGHLTTYFYGDGVYSRYSGSLKNGKMDGYGTFITNKSEKYVGYFKYGLFHGRGLLISKDEKMVIDCEWYNDEIIRIYGERKATRSELQSLDLDNYEPLFSAKSLSHFGDVHCQGNCKDGYGIYSFDNGDVYEGYWEGGLFNGKGSYTTTDNYKLEGNWKEGRLEGRGYLETDIGKKIYASFGIDLELDKQGENYSEKILIYMILFRTKLNYHGKLLADYIRSRTIGDKVYVGEVYNFLNPNLEHFNYVFTSSYYRNYYVEYNSKFRNDIPDFVPNIDVSSYKVSFQSLIDVVETWGYRNKEIFRCLLDFDNKEYNHSVHLLTITFTKGFADSRLEFNFLCFFGAGMDDSIAIIDLDTFKYMDF